MLEEYATIYLAIFPGKRIFDVILVAQINIYKP